MSIDSKTIFCIIDMFAEKQRVIIPGGRESSIRVGKIPAFTIEFAYANNMEKVHLIGPKAYVEAIAQEIAEYESLNYSHNKIEIEVN